MISRAGRVDGIQHPPLIKAEDLDQPLDALCCDIAA